MNNNNIVIRGAKLHNLKNITVEIPKNKLVVVTGLSGSGKSSLAFDTLYAEGQRRYVESLSSYARQFLGKLDKPKVDFIDNISPAIAIEQKVNTSNPRSTVGTSTEIYDYIKLLYARIGQTFSPVSGVEVKKHSVSDVIDFVKSLPEGQIWLLMAPITKNEHRTYQDSIRILKEQGYVRAKIGQKVVRLDEVEPNYVMEDFFLVLERIIPSKEDDYLQRVADSVDLAFFEGKGVCVLEKEESGEKVEFSNKFEADGITFNEPNIHLFDFNNPYGACPVCNGYGDTIGLDMNLIVPNTDLSVYQGAIYPWRGNVMSYFQEELISNSSKFDFPIHKPWKDLSQEQKDLVWTGNKYFTGIEKFFKELDSQSYKVQNRVLISRYSGKTKCNHCNGTRLTKEASYVKINGRSIPDIVNLPITKVLEFFEGLELTDYRAKVSQRLLKEITTRLKYLIDVGLDYLTLNRKSSTLSGGESQRINLSTSLGSSLVGSMYILDEPSIGLHPKDTQKLIGVLKNLRDLGNTVIVVEHDRDVMKQADYIIDVGPEAGRLGGEVVAKGTYEQILNADTLTGKYLSGRMKIQRECPERKSPNYIKVVGARENNLKDIDVVFPLDMIVAVTGVSGSGKSTLVKQILYPALCREIFGSGDAPGEFTALEGKYKNIKNLEFVDQNPIGRSTRSNPVTYIKVYDDIRALFAEQPLSKIRGFQPKHFSFNSDGGGRCDSCNGDGQIVVPMQFMADVYLECDVCHGKRFKKEILDVTFSEKNISDVLDMTVDEAIDFFLKNKQTKIAGKLKPLQDVGLGYVTLGQPSSTLSGGEAQRIKLASFLTKSESAPSTLFFFDEPTTGLHFDDVKKLLHSFNALVEKGHSIIVVEHNMEVVRNVDYIIDLGLNGGDKGGEVVDCGTPTEVEQRGKGYTAGELRREKQG